MGEQLSPSVRMLVALVFGGTLGALQGSLTVTPTTKKCLSLLTQRTSRERKLFLQALSGRGLRTPKAKGIEYLCSPLVLVPIEQITPSLYQKGRLLITTCVAQYATHEDLATLTDEGQISPTSPPSPQWHAWHQTQMAIDYHRQFDESGSDTVRRLARDRDTANAEVKALKAALERQQSDAKLCIEDLERSLDFQTKRCDWQRSGMGVLEDRAAKAERECVDRIDAIRQEQCLLTKAVSLKVALDIAPSESRLCWRIRYAGQGTHGISSCEPSEVHSRVASILARFENS